MPIALESDVLFDRGVPAACAWSSSAGRGSSSQAEAVHLGESEESEAEVQSSLRGPFDTMDALQEALPLRPATQSAQRREASKINNTKSSSLANAADVVLSPQSSNGLGPLPFSIDQDESRSKELSPVGDIYQQQCRAPSSLAAASSSPCKSRSEYEHGCCKPCLFFSSCWPSNSFILVSMVGHQDVGASTDVISPRTKRRKN
ncbi:hypothetical protein VPH35_121833 [Triticum aestivum]